MTAPITNLKDEMPVTAGAIASRPLLDLPGSTKLVLFAMDEGQEISAHHALPALVHLLDGAISRDGGHLDRSRPRRPRRPCPRACPTACATGPSHWLLTMRRGARGE